jgi:hypothetical protein
MKVYSFLKNFLFLIFLGVVMKLMPILLLVLLVVLAIIVGNDYINNK